MKTFFKKNLIFQDLEEGAGDRPNAGQNMVYFIKKLRQLVPNMIISQPTYGYPKVTTKINFQNKSSFQNSNLLRCFEFQILMVVISNVIYNSIVRK
jgi:hypothetical protein